VPAKVEATPALPGLSRIAGKPIIARFDGDQSSSDIGVLALCEVERRVGVADRTAWPSPQGRDSALADADDRHRL